MGGQRVVAICAPARRAAGNPAILADTIGRRDRRVAGSAFRQPRCLCAEARWIGRRAVDHERRRALPRGGPPGARPRWSRMAPAARSWHWEDDRSGSGDASTRAASRPRSSPVDRRRRRPVHGGQRPVPPSGGRPTVPAGRIVAWLDGRPGFEGVYARRITSAGAVQWTFNGVPLTNQGNGEQVSVVADGAGGVIATWRDHRTTDPRPLRATHQRRRDTAVDRANGIAVCSVIGDQQYPRQHVGSSRRRHHRLERWSRLEPLRHLHATAQRFGNRTLDGERRPDRRRRRQLSNSTGPRHRRRERPPTPRGTTTAATARDDRPLRSTGHLRRRASASRRWCAVLRRARESIQHRAHDGWRRWCVRGMAGLSQLTRTTPSSSIA